MAAKRMRSSIGWRFAARLCVLTTWALVATVQAQTLTVRIADPYIELHTGPGSAYPIFQIAQRGETIEVLKSKADWFKVRTQSQHEGWVPLAQLEATLVASGDPLRIPKASIANYFSRHTEMGIAGGVLEDEPMMSLRLAYLFHPSFALELSISQISGTFASSQLYQSNLVALPFPDWRLAPFFSIGLGWYKSTPKLTLVDAESLSAPSANAGVGLRYYLTRRLMFRGDFKSNTVLINDNRVDEYWAWSGGLSFFF